MITLTASGAGSYAWYNSNSSQVMQGNPLTVRLMSTSTFTAVGTATNGCSNRATITQNVANCTGLTEINSTIQGLQVFPNPSTGIFNLEVQNGELNKVKITDITGRVIFNYNGNENKLKIDISGYTAGVYFAEITSGGNTEVVRLVKN
jgi:hypothetical protein